jgi:hypothetical protein
MISAYVIKIELNTRMISQKVIESIKPTLKKMVDDSLLPHLKKIQSAHHVINLQREEIDKQNTIIQTLQYF